MEIAELVTYTTTAVLFPHIAKHAPRSGNCNDSTHLTQNDAAALFIVECISNFIVFRFTAMLCSTKTMSDLEIPVIPNAKSMKKNMSHIKHKSVAHKYQALPEETSSLRCDK